MILAQATEVAGNNWTIAGGATHLAKMYVDGVEAALAAKIVKTTNAAVDGQSILINKRTVLIQEMAKVQTVPAYPTSMLAKEKDRIIGVAITNKDPQILIEFNTKHGKSTKNK